ncbi:S phase cyclin A-associated protein in the endoplasmic reticulum [Holothuria leucospilota]|uniref:S phase cyclin A-associated protein in the endoplasmic reticulum n=1 Tax=Holothuria leucospilota TaxID=206669 RepID=A0A9Q1BMA5_HOLLE|nr:S phase cyclin A-associated protein in the endoplasmic reticulum [Holothuria leucospilota]
MSESSSRRRSNSGNKGRLNGPSNGSEGRRSEGNYNSNGHRSKGKAYQRTGSFDNVRSIVKEEGRMARNLVTWNVPVDSDDSDGQGQGQGHQVRPKRKTRAYTPSKSSTPKSPKKLSGLSSSDNKSSSSGESRAGDKSSSCSEKRMKKVDMRARYWAFLFDNLQRAVDEIYQTCEIDESIVECKEVIMILKSATQDFEALIKRINVQKDFENADENNKPTSLVWEVRKSLSSPAKNRTPSWPGDARLPTNRRPRSLAWEVRKSSPHRITGTASPVDARDRQTPSPVNRSLNFSVQEKDKLSAVQPVPTTTSGPSWADRVKGRQVVKPVAVMAPSHPVETPPTDDIKNKKNEELTQAAIKEEAIKESQKEDEEGWETVHRGKPNRCRPSSGKSSGHQRAITTRVTGNKSTRRERADSEKENKPEGLKETTSNIEIKEQGKSDEILRSLPKPNIQDDDPAILETGKEEPLISPTEPGSKPVVEDEEVLAVELEKDDSSDPDDDDEKTLTEQLEKYEEEAEAEAQKLEQVQDEAIAEAIAAEETLSKQIEEEENKVILVETDEGESDLGNTLSSMESSQRTLDWNDVTAEFERYSVMSWAELVDDNLESREPGHALHMHEKLSSPSRKRSKAESQKRHEERQAKAQRKREQVQDEKNQKLKMLHEKIEEVRKWKNYLLTQKKIQLEDKQRRAEEKRQKQLQMVVKKAQEEEAKANEIAFINSLEASNKRHDILARHQGHEARYNDILEERQRKNEEKAAKEEAVQERKKHIEEARQAKMEAIQKHRKDQEEKMNQMKDQRDLAREIAAKEKARDREERLSALQAAQQAKEEEIQKKIQQRHDETMKRHTQLMEQKREKAIELSMLRHYKTSDVAPQQKPYSKKMFCSLCNVLIPSEVYLLSHLRGRSHREIVLKENKGVPMTEDEMENFALKAVVEATTGHSDPKEMAEKERQRACKKRARKLRQRMTSRGKEYENNLPSKLQVPDSQHKAKLQKLIKDMNKYLQQQSGVSLWDKTKVSALDRALGEISRIMEKRDQADQIALRCFGGLSTLSRVLLLIDTSNHGKSNPVPIRTMCSAATAFRLTCRNCYDNCQYILYSSKLGPIVELLMHQLHPQSQDDSDSTKETSEMAKKTDINPLTGCLLQLLTSILHCLIRQKRSVSSTDSKSTSSAKQKQADTFDQWATDIIGYIVNCGVVDQLADYLNSVQGPIDDDKETAEFLQHSLGLLATMTRFSASTMKSPTDLFISQKEDQTNLLMTLRATGLAGIVSLLYGVLLHGGTPARGSTAAPPELPEHTLSVVSAGIKMLSSVASIDLHLLQGAMGAEGISLEFRHIATYLIWYCSHFTLCSDMLHEVILIVGYFSLKNTDNQMLIQSGHTPTLLQQLCSLPFQYFSDPKLKEILFPSLICCCYGNQENKMILEQEMSCSLLVTFLEERIQEQNRNELLPTAASAREKEKERDGSARMGLELRFPKSEWTAAVNFFKT